MALYDLIKNDKEEMKGERVEGVFLGIVTNNRDPENTARIKVKFPWLSDESHWARVTTLMAGNNRGIFFLPEVGDEVLVAFDHGDLNHPYVIGALWNGENSPPETNSNGGNNVRKIRSRLGHEIILNDEENRGRIEIHTNAGHKIILDDSSDGQKIEIKDTRNNSIIINSVENSIAISSQMRLGINAQSIEIEAGANMTIRSRGTLTIEASLVKIN